MPQAYDYSSYGEMKMRQAAGESRWERLSRRMGVRNRYLRLVRGIDLTLPVVELGCGDGSFIRALHNFGFKHVQGVDLSPSYAMSEDCVVGDAQSFLRQQAPASVGLILALDVFEHISQPELLDLLLLAKSRLQKDGRIVFRVPNMGSPLGLINQFGDLSHRLGLNEISVRQLAFEAGLQIHSVEAEPFAYPRSLSTILGYLAWPIYRTMTKLAYAAFGQHVRILTPNLICQLTKPI